MKVILYIDLCDNNLSHLTFGLFGVQVRFFLLNIFVTKNDMNEYSNIFVSKNNTNVYLNIFIYKNDTNEYSYRKILEYPNTRQTLV